MVAAAVTGQLFDMSDISTRGYLLLATAGLIHFLVGRYATYRCVAAIGANRATPVRSVSIPFTLLMAVFLLGESVSAINGVGIVIVVLAPMIMFRREGRAQGSAGTARSNLNPGELPPAASSSTAFDISKTATVDTSRLAEGYLFGLITALAFGSSPLLIRGAIGDTGLGIAGALVAYGTAAVPLVLGLAWPGRLAGLRGMDRTALRWFLLATVATFFLHMFRFAALDLAPVTVVSPLMRTGVIFTVLFAFLINRQLEAFGPRVLAAIALSIVGSVFVVI